MAQILRRVLVDEFDEVISTPIRKDLEGGGKVAVGTTAVEVTFAGVPQAIIISADPSNEGVLYVGKSDVTNLGGNAFCFLYAGEHIELSYNDKNNPIYVVADTADQNFWKGALT